MPKFAKPIKDDGKYVFSDFSNGLYLLDTPRGLAEQLASLCLVGGRNVWTEKSALVSQYGYLTVGSIPSEEMVVAVTQDDQASSNFFIVCASGKVYLYTAAQGLKEYKSTLSNEVIGEVSVARRGNDLIACLDGAAYLFGGAYENSSTTVSINDKIEIADFSTYYEFKIPVADEKYYWNGKEIYIDAVKATVQSITTSTDSNLLTIRATSADHQLLQGELSISEKALLPMSLTYTPEDSAISTRTIEPVQMAVCINRLFIEDVTGDIYYSQVGVIDSFKEALGAGYFGGFYNDTSKLLSIEDYYNGALIAKENGLYHLTIGDSVKIEKLAQIGQQYAGDHIIEGNKVIAYDSNSSKLVVAIQQSYFGNLVAGKDLVSSEFLDAANNGIANSRRHLTCNTENNAIILYYGEKLNKGLVLNSNTSLFPRELDKQISKFITFNNGTIAITTDGLILQDFKKGTIIPSIAPYAEFEAIGLRDNRVICSSILEVTELNGIGYSLTTSNATSSFQHITPPSQLGLSYKDVYPPMLYADKENNFYPDSYALERKWAEKASNVTRIYAPMSGRNGVTISIQFNPNEVFCLAALRLPDFSQGE